MKVYDLFDQDGRPFAFEVSSLVTRGGACGVVRRIAGVRVLREPIGRAGWSDDVFCEFELQGVRFQLWEPYGDNSRFWVGPEPVRPTAELAVVRDAFARTGLLAAVFASTG